MNISIISAKVLLTNGADKIFLQTCQPCPFTVAALPSQPPLSLDFDATYDTGVEYVREVFCIEPEIINIRVK